MSGFLMKLLTGRPQYSSNNEEQALRGTVQGSLSVAQFEPACTEAARAGYRFVGGTQVIANGIAPVSAIPTTTATLALWNGENATGRSYAIQRVHFGLGSGTAAAGATLFLGISPAAVSAPSAASNYSSQSASAGGKTTRARWATAQTFASGCAWFAAASTFQLAAANVGQGDGNGYVSEGGIIVPPGYALGIAILSGSGTTPLYYVSAEWCELALDLE